MLRFARSCSYPVAKCWKSAQECLVLLVLLATNRATSGPWGILSSLDTCLFGCWYGIGAVGRSFEGPDGCCSEMCLPCCRDKRSHTAVAVDEAENEIARRRVIAGPNQLAELNGFAAGLGGECQWAVEASSGAGLLLPQQFARSGIDVVDVPPTLAARVRLLAQAGFARALSERLTRVSRTRTGDSGGIVTQIATNHILVALHLGGSSFCDHRADLHGNHAVTHRSK